MNLSKLDLCNMALAMAGSSQEIHALDYSEGATVPNEARWCKRFWPLALAAVAREHNWKCLTARKDISAQITTDPAFGYDAAYTLPADCARVLGLEDSTLDWTVEGRRLLTDETTVKIAYVRESEDTSLYDALFAEALVMRLAAYLAHAIHPESDSSRADALRSWHEKVSLPSAMRADAAERSPVVIESSTWKDSRL